MGLFTCKNCTSVLYSVGAYLFFFYGFLIFYNFSSLTTYFQMGSIYTRPVFPTSRALITVVEKKVHISAAQQRKRKVSFLIINSASSKTLGFLCEV